MFCINRDLLDRDGVRLGLGLKQVDLLRLLGLRLMTDTRVQLGLVFKGLDGQRLGLGMVEDPGLRTDLGLKGDPGRSNLGLIGPELSLGMELVGALQWG